MLNGTATCLTAAQCAYLTSGKRAYMDYLGALKKAKEGDEYQRAHSDTQKYKAFLAGIQDYKTQKAADP